LIININIRERRTATTSTTPPTMQASGPRSPTVLIYCMTAIETIAAKIHIKMNKPTIVEELNLNFLDRPPF